MSAYVLVSYDIDDPKGFEPYVAGVLSLLQKHGGEVLVADFEARSLEGEKRGVYVVLRFASEEAALTWYNDPAYAAVKKIRLDSCSHNHMVLTKAFVPPAA